MRTDRSTLKEKNGKPLPILPGMTAMVEVRTGERSVLSFILRPMMKSQEAFRER
jgi:adhesin transport system membrane fusion protein